jgi:hypothetical protein
MSVKTIGSRATAIYKQQSKMSQMKKKSPLGTNPLITFLIDKITLGMNRRQLSSTLIHPHHPLLTTRILRGSVITIFIGGPFNPFSQGTNMVITSLVWIMMIFLGQRASL